MSIVDVARLKSAAEAMVSVANTETIAELRQITEDIFAITDRWDNIGGTTPITKAFDRDASIALADAVAHPATRAAACSIRIDHAIEGLTSSEDALDEEVDDHY